MKIKKQHFSQSRVSIPFLILPIFFFTAVKCYASPVSLGVYPPLLKIKTAPNAHIQQRITISNYGDTPTIAIISLKMFTSSPKNNGQITFLPNDTKTKNFFSENIKVLDGNIPVNQILLAPKENKSLTIDLTGPKDQADGDYYISVLFISNTTDQVKSNTTTLSEGVVMNILFSILSRPSTNVGYIKQFSAPSLVDNDSLPFTVEVINQGNHFTTVTGAIKINNMLFKSKEIIPLQSVDLLKNASRYMTDKEGVTTSQVVWTHGFLFGVYRADLDIYFGDNKNGFHRSIYFYSYPIVGFVIALGVMFFLGIVLFRIHKKRI